MTVTITAESIWDDVEKIRQSGPLVHNITNFVVMNNTANALLALGASPVMAHAVEEVEEMTSIASALVINIGTLSRDWICSMKTAMAVAAKRHIPIILDPVGVGATSYRTQTCHQLMAQTRPTIIRGNASEILALTDATIKTKGVDSTTGKSPQQAAETLVKEQSAVVVVSGTTDLICDRDRHLYLNNGHLLMPRVTGLGCTASALTGAFAAVQADPFRAAAHAMAVMGICGEIAAMNAIGPGSLQMNFIDSLYQLNKQQIVDHLRVN